MEIAYKAFLVIGLIVAVLFTLLVLFTGKGDAMSGGGGVRTSFKGKASFDDYMTRILFISGVSLMVLLLLIDILGNHVKQ